MITYRQNENGCKKVKTVRNGYGTYQCKLTYKEDFIQLTYKEDFIQFEKLSTFKVSSILHYPTGSTALLRPAFVCCIRSNIIFFSYSFFSSSV